MSETDLLTEIYPEHVPADKGMRFINFFIDLIVFYILVFCVSFIIALAAGGAYDYQSESTGEALLFNLFFLFSYALYYGLLEGITRGRSLGKLITKTKAVREDGSEISFADAFKRGLCRSVPFELLSGFADRPWHDKWTSTTVVKINT